MLMMSLVVSDYSMVYYAAFSTSKFSLLANTS